MAEFRPKEEADLLPGGTRGIYILFRQRRRTGCFDVVYVGLSRAGVRSRLRGHRHSKTKAKLWSHFSLFEVWDNVSDAEVAELEGLFRHAYRRDSRAIRLNIQRQRKHRPFSRVREDDLRAWSSNEEESS
jgi:hypothetical protein